MPLFFTAEDLARAAARSAPWPGYDEAFLLQPAPAAMRLPDGRLQHAVLRHDGVGLSRTATDDGKFASWVVSGCCVAHALGRGPRFAEAARGWIAALVGLPIWDVPRQGPPTRPEIDLNYGNAAYACAFFLDLCGGGCEPAFRDALVAKMIAQVELGDGRFARRPVEDHAFTQNHFYIPFTGHLAMCLALRPYWPGAKERIARARDFIIPLFAGIGRDGWYYEGVNYCHYAVIWLVRLAELAERHLGLAVADAPCLRHLHRFLRWSMFPAGRHFFNVGDNSSKNWSFATWAEADRADALNWNDTWISNCAQILLWIGRRTGDPACRQVAEDALRRGLHPAEGFWWALWDDAPAGPVVAEASHHFADAGVWAADRGDGAGNVLRLLARCGPPMGHGLELDAAGRPRHRFNAGHVHPDAGTVCAAWNHLPVVLGPGYLGRKAGTALNTILIDGLGQEDDRLYHAFLPDQVDYPRLRRLALRPDAEGAELDFAAAYRPAQGVEQAARRVAFLGGRGFAVADTVRLRSPARIEARFRIAEAPRRCGERGWSWRVEGQEMRCELGDASCPVELWAAPGDVTTINDDGSPGPLEAGRTCQRGWQLIIRTQAKETGACWTIRFLIP